MCTTRGTLLLLYLLSRSCTLRCLHHKPHHLHFHVHLAQGLKYRYRHCAYSSTWESLILWEAAKTIFLVVGPPKRGGGGR